MRGRRRGGEEGGRELEEDGGGRGRGRRRIGEGLEKDVFDR